MEVCCRTPTRHPRQCVAMSERDDALRLREAKGVGVVAVLTTMVASPTIVTVLACWTVPDRVSGLKLTTDAAAVGEGGGSR